MLYVMAKLTDGREVVSEFGKLKGIRRLSQDVFSGRKGFPVWRPVGNRHPVSGEEGVQVRRRVFIAGRDVVEMEVVKPIAGREDNHDFDPEAFEPVGLVNTGSAGKWTAPAGRPEEWPEGAPYAEGTEYPIHRDADSQRRFVIARQDGDVTDRFWLDPERRTTYAEAVGSAPGAAAGVASEDDPSWSDDDDWADDDWDEDDEF